MAKDAQAAVGRCMNGPVFIGGPPRSGTGMMRALLGSNSQLAIPPKEYHFFANSQPYDAVALLESVLALDKVRKWGLENADAMTLLAGTDHSKRAVYSAPLMAYARQCAKPRFGEKTPFLERHFETLQAWFGPSMRFVQMVRDPLATYASRCNQGGIRAAIDPVRFARVWRASVLRGLNYASRFPGQYRIVRYEDVLDQPGETVLSLCHFCNLPDEMDRMLTMADFTRKRNSSFSGDDLDFSGRNAIGTASFISVDRFDRWLIRRELGALADGLPLAETPASGGPLRDADSNGTNALGLTSVATRKLFARLRRT